MEMKKTASQVLGAIPGQAILEAINNGEQRKIAGLIGENFEQMLYEEGIARKILDFKPTLKEEQILDHTTNTLYSVFQLPSDFGTSIESNFQDVPTAKQVSAGWARINYGRMVMPKLLFNEMEMMALQNRPLAEAKEKSMYNIMEKEDRNMIAAMDVAVSITDKVIRRISDKVFSPEIFRELKNFIDGDRMRATTIVSAKTALNDLYLWDRNTVGEQGVGNLWNSNNNVIDTKEFGNLEWIGSLKEDLFIRVFYKTIDGGETTDIYDPKVEKDASGKAIVARRERDFYVLAGKEMRGHARVLKNFEIGMKKENGIIEMTGDCSQGFCLFSRAVGKVTISG